jgi:hypothetical protein
MAGTATRRARRCLALVVVDILGEHDPDTVDVAYTKFAKSVRLIGGR